MDNTVPLRNLVLSPLNVRKTDPDIEIAEMAVSIHERGLLQNLIVCPALADDDGQADFAERLELPDMFEVLDGGRRYRALLLNAELGRIDPEHLVPVVFKPRDTGRETSLAANRERIAMNPVDEIEAFADIVGASAGDGLGERIHQCARRFNVTDRYVAQRLALSALAPEILDALRADDISLDAAKAYAAIPDHPLQMTVFAAENSRWGTRHDPRQIRDALRSKTYPAKIPQALYVGHLAYLAAGGRIDRDLFMGADEDDKLLDPSIVDQLAREKAEGDLPGQVKLDGFASGILLPAFVIHAAWPKPPAGYRRSLRPADGLGKKDRKTTIGVYGLQGDGSGLDCVGYFEAIPEGGAVSVAVASAPGNSNERPHQSIDHDREDRILRCAARLAISAIEPPALLDRVVWSAMPVAAVEVDADDERSFLVDIQVRVSRAELEAMRAPAELELEVLS